MIYEFNGVAEPGCQAWWLRRNPDGVVIPEWVESAADGTWCYRLPGARWALCRQAGVTWTGPIPMSVAKASEETNREHLLGEALRKTLVKIGVVRADADPTGPELLAAVQTWDEEYAYSHGEQHASDFPKDGRKKPKPAPSEDEGEEFARLCHEIDHGEWGEHPSHWASMTEEHKLICIKVARRIRAECAGPWKELEEAVAQLCRANEACPASSHVQGVGMSTARAKRGVAISRVLMAFAALPDQGEVGKDKPNLSDRELGQFADEVRHRYASYSLRGAAIRAKLGGE